MLSRKDGTIVERSRRPSARNANIGNPFGIKFIGRDFKAVYPYHTLLNAIIEGDMLIMSFAKGITVECKGSNLEAILDSIWTARLQLVEETREIRNGSRVLAEGEIVVESLRYCTQADIPKL
jgi:hypothetical protein